MESFPSLVTLVLQVLLIQSLFLFQIGDSTTRATFGETCNKEHRCETRAMLSCNKGACQCLMPDAMVFHKDNERCVSLAGERCVYIAAEGDRTWSEEVPCVSNSKCVGALCACHFDYFELGNGSCAEKKVYGGDCLNLETINMCKRHLICGNNQTCVCEEGRVYDEMHKSCVHLAGRSCSTPEDNPEDDKCVENSLCQDEICNCLPGFFQAENGTCKELRDFGGECSRNEMCISDKFLECGNTGRCECVVSRAYDSERKMCLIGTGHVCLENSEVECVSNSYCIYEEPQFRRNSLGFSYRHRHIGGHRRVGRCTCAKNFYESEEGTCEEKRGYGESCSDNSHCKDVIPPPPNSQTPTDLICGNGTCICDSRLSLRNTAGAGVDEYPCVRLSGMSCRAGQRCIPNGNCSYAVRCECEREFFTTTEKTCEKKQDYGGSCETSEGCMDGLHLNCNLKGICECDDTTAFHPEKKICVGRSNSSCSNGCVPNAICSGFGGNKCTCLDYATNSREDDGYCFVKEGLQCDSDSEMMTSAQSNRTKTCLHGLVCANDVCSCLIPDHQVYDTSQEKCFSLIGGPCNDTLQCVDNAQCIEENGLQICRCKEGFTPVDRQCDLSFGQNCIQGQSTPKCDRWAPLKCSVRSKCECSDFQKYDGETRKCSGLVGAKCQVKNEGFCSEGTFCKSFRGSKRGVGMCVCEDGLHPQADRTCHDEEDVFGQTEETNWLEVVETTTIASDLSPA